MYDSGVQFEWWGELIGWLIAVCCALIVPVNAIYVIMQEEGDFTTRVKKLLTMEEKKLDFDETKLLKL